MPADLIWDDPAHTTMRATYTDPWTWAEFLHIGNDMNAWLDAADGTVDIIVDVTASQRLPPNLTWGIIEYMDQHGPLAHPRLGTLVLMGADRFYRIAYKLFLELLARVGHKLAYAESLQEARALLAMRRAERGRRH